VDDSGHFISLRGLIFLVLNFMVLILTVLVFMALGLLGGGI